MKKLAILCSIFGFAMQSESAMSDSFENHPYVSWLNDEVSWQGKEYRKLRPPTPEESQRHKNDYNHFRGQWEQRAKQIREEITHIRSSFNCGSLQMPQQGMPLSPSQTRAHAACKREAELRMMLDRYQPMAENYRPLRAVTELRDSIYPYNDPETYQRLTGETFGESKDQAREHHMANDGFFRSYAAYDAFHQSNRGMEVRPIPTAAQANPAHAGPKEGGVKKLLKNAFRNPGAKK